MSSPMVTGALDTQARALLQRVTEDSARRCAALHAAAESQATQILRAARTNARGNVSTAVIQERARMDFGLRQAAARADIELRRQERLKSRELLEQMWAAMSGILEDRWRQPALRRAWVDAVMSQAAAILAGRAWLIEVASDWSEQERGGFTDRAHKRGAAGVEYALHADMAAGLKIRAGSVCVDATVPGLLVQRDVVEAAFLAEYIPVEQRIHA
jgi:hypothetical protein